MGDDRSGGFDPGALSRLAKQLLDDIVVRLVPVPRLLQRPVVDDVAYQVERFGFGGAQEVEQQVCLCAARAEMEIGYPDGSEAAGSVGSPSACRG